MQRAKHWAEFKAEAFKERGDKGHTVVRVAARLGLSEVLLYTQMRKFKATKGTSVGDMRSMWAKLEKLNAEMKRTTEGREIKKRPPRTLPSSSGKVRVHAGSP